MDNMFIYLMELNIALLILFAAYKLFFEKDKNFVVRRIFLLGILIIPVILPLIPATVRLAVNRYAPVSFNLEEITIYAFSPETQSSGAFNSGNLLVTIYLSILGLGLVRFSVQLWGVCRAIRKSERTEVDGRTILTNTPYNASSFFGYIFIDASTLQENTFTHILDHEQIHRKEWHSVDRILVELFVMINWFNPVAWIYRKAVIENLEYLADSAVIHQGANPAKYQLSIINQYIGSASIQNQFNSQIKNRINMLNKDYKLGSSWKLALILPLVAIAFIAISCSEKNSREDAVYKVIEEMPQPNDALGLTLADEELFSVVEEMPSFNGGEPIEFRKYIAENIRYPEEAAQNGVTGRILIKFVVTKTGKIVVPQEQYLANKEGKSLDEVVVVAYHPLNEEDVVPSEKYIQLLKDEVIRVVGEAPDWKPGKQKGEAVNVMFTFPVNFVLQ
ncbi:MAG: M56 family metallopeptidase [Bacteroidota bacterium]